MKSIKKHVFHRKCSQVMKWIISYETAETYEEKINVFLSQSIELNIMKDMIKNKKNITLKKNIKLSRQWKKEGNKIFKTKSKNYLDFSIESFTKSIAFAPIGSKELSLGYANRSVVLLKSNLYENCLLDIEQALKTGYPDNLKAKLFIRQMLCFHILKPHSKLESSISYANVLQWLPKMNKNNANYKIVENIMNNYQQISMSLGNPHNNLSTSLLDTTNYESFHNLIKHLPPLTECISLKNVGIMTATAILLMQPDILGTNLTSKEWANNKWIPYTAGLLLKYKFIFDYNFLANADIFEDDYTNKLMVVEPMIKVFRHSCNPNANDLIHQSTTSIFATKPIKKGEENVPRNASKKLKMIKKKILEYVETSGEINKEKLIKAVEDACVTSDIYNRNIDFLCHEIIGLPLVVQKLYHQIATRNFL
ncbi:hypothetical protein HCN44_001613 [Aphidius gifuensis]|uniref:SET domain-containing protein n=1 Tax=Aphidius gifuensis TaxID=684658 RepID=A0A834XTN6_APHGI|nr:hypothetical protein HCN44_001613 [Aphidius gifuensis]